MIEYIMVGLARIRFAFLGAFIWMLLMVSLFSLGYNGFFDTFLEVLIFYPTGVLLVLGGLILDEYYWEKLIKN